MRNSIFFVSVFVLSFLVLGQVAEAKIIFDWSETKVVSQQKRLEAEKRFSLAAQKYLTDKYANLGPYDFVHSSEKFFVAVFDDYEKQNETKGDYLPGANGGSLCVDPSIFDNLNLFQIVSMHELCHAYDYIMTDKMRKSSRKPRSWYHNYLMVNEKRAFQKEKMYAEEMRSLITPEEYRQELKRLETAHKKGK